MTDLGMPTKPASPAEARSQSGPVVFTEGHHFQLADDTSIDGLLAQITAPLLRKGSVP